MEQKWQEVATRITTIPVTPYKKDISVDLFGIGWMPYHLVLLDNQLETLPAFQIQEK